MSKLVKVLQCGCHLGVIYNGEVLIEVGKQQHGEVEPRFFHRKVGLAQIALAIEIKDRTNSGLWVGAVLVVGFLPTILVGLTLGPLIDRLERRKLMVNGLNAIGLDCYMPRGAFYAFPSIARTGMTSDEFAEKLLFEEKVAVVPGSAFGAGGEGFVRCTYCTAQDKISEALERMGRFVKNYS